MNLLLEIADDGMSEALGLEACGSMLIWRRYGVGYFNSLMRMLRNETVP